MDDVEEKEKKEDPPRKNFKYYFNRFRYYHYYIAEKVDTFIAFICMWVIKIQLYFMGYDINGLPSINEIGQSSPNFDED